MGDVEGFSVVRLPQSSALYNMIKKVMYYSKAMKLFQCVFDKKHTLLYSLGLFNQVDKAANL